MFWQELFGFLELCAVTNSWFLLVGDFNFHVDVSHHPAAQHFLALMNSFGLQQHVTGPTHRLGHTLDLVFSLSGGNFVRDCCVSERIGGSDHHAVLTTVRAHKPSMPRKTIAYRPTKAFDLTAFAADLSWSPFVSLPTNDIDVILDQFSSSVGHDMRPSLGLTMVLVARTIRQPGLAQKVLPLCIGPCQLVKQTKCLIGDIKKQLTFSPAGMERS